MFGDVVLNTESSFTYWTACLPFRPTESEITVYFFHLEGRISNRLKNFYVEIENNYQILKEKIAKQLRINFSLEFRSNLAPQIEGTIKVSSISLPTEQELQTGKFDWDFYFTFEYGDSVQGYVAEMENWQVADICVNPVK